MGVKYVLQYKSIDDVSWQCDIETMGYSGPLIAIHGVSEQAAEIDYDGDTADNAFNPFIKSTLALNFYNEGQVDIDELMGAADKDFLAKLFRNGHLYWTGFIQPENIQRPLTTPPYNCTITFTCGLSMLDDMPYIHQDLPGTTGTLTRCPMNYIRQILFSNLGIKLPIRWTNQIQCTAFGDDFFTGSVRWSPFNEGIYTYQQGVLGEDRGPTQKCGYILAGFLQAIQCRIYQSKGKWIIRRVNDVIAGNISYKEISADFGVMTVLAGIENLSQRIGRTGYRFISENAVLTNVQGIKSFKTTYTANIRNNIIPNGNFDILITNLTVIDVLSGHIFLYWGTYDTALLVNNVASLDGQAGWAVELTSDDETFFTMVSQGGILGKNGLPIDALTLIKVINFGFMFSGGIGFAPVDDNDLIIWDSQPLQFKMILNQGVNSYYLNEFGFWTTTDAFINIVVEGLKLGEIAQINFDKFQGIKIPPPLTQPKSGDTCDIQIIFKVKNGQTYTIDNLAITVDNGNDVYEVFNDASKNTSSDNIDLNISSSFGGYMLSNFMSSALNSDTECGFNDGALYQGTLTGINSHAMMRFRYKASQIVNTDISVANGNWSFDEIYSVDSLLGKKFLPLNAKYYTEKATANIIAIEARNDNITLRENFYNSNDNSGSN